MNRSILLSLAAFYGMTAVILGAFGAHALRDRLDASQLVSFETGVRYQLIHAVVLFGVAILAAQSPSALLTGAGRLLAVGIPLFSVSIYVLATRHLTGWSGVQWLGPVTPLGGLCLIVGWGLLLIWSLRLFSF